MGSGATYTLCGKPDLTGKKERKKHMVNTAQKKERRSVIGQCAPYVFLLLVSSYLFLWPFRGLISALLLLLFIGGTSIFFGRWIIETRLRLTRYRHNEETPLDASGEPMYYPVGAQTNPYHRGPFVSVETHD